MSKTSLGETLLAEREGPPEMAQEMKLVPWECGVRAHCCLMGKTVKLPKVPERGKDVKETRTGKVLPGTLCALHG